MAHLGNHLAYLNARRVNMAKQCCGEWAVLSHTISRNLAGRCGIHDEGARRGLKGRNTPPDSDTAGVGSGKSSLERIVPTGVQNHH